MTTEVIMPQLGESVVEGTILRWHKRVGDPVQALEVLLEISTDKVDAEIPAPAGGVLLEILVPEGQTVVKGTKLAVIGEAQALTSRPERTLTPQPPLPHGEGEAAPLLAQRGGAGGRAELGNGQGNTQGNGLKPTVSTPLPEGEGPGVRASRKEPGARAAHGPHITPVVARMAAEHHLDLSKIAGTGHEGRVTRKDVEAFLAAPTAAPAETELPPWERPGTGDLFKPSVEYEAAKSPTPGHAAARHALPVQPPPATAAPPQTPDLVAAQYAVLASYGQDSGDGHLVRLSPMRRVIAERLTETAQTVPMVTTVFEVDLSAVLAHRDAHKAEFAAQNVNLTLTAYFALASVAALQAVPALNSEWRAEGIFQHQAAHLGIAVALDPGLIVPVIRHAERLNLRGMAQAVNQVVAEARANRLSPDDTHGSTFTITNHGTGGSLLARPILNAPNAGILGVGTVEKRVRVQTGAQGRDSLFICPCVYLTLTFDHRLADGAEGDAFLRVVKDTLEGWK